MLCKNCVAIFLHYTFVTYFLSVSANHVLRSFIIVLYILFESI